MITNIPSTEELIILGDFNARVGADCDSRPSCLGPFEVEKLKENGQRLLGLRTFHNLCITNFFFKTKPQHKVSWRHPRSKHFRQLDLILVRRAAIKNVLHTRSYHSADCDTDHSLVCCKIRLQPKKFHCAKKPGTPRIDVSKMTHPDLVEQFAVAFQKEYDASQPGDTATEKWEALRDTIHRTALATFGKKTSKSHDWFEAKSSVMSPIIEAKHNALVNTSGHPPRGTCRCSGLPAHRQALRQRSSTGKSSVRQFRRLLQRATSEECTTASRSHRDQRSAVPLNPSLWKSSLTKDGRWIDGWNTIRTSTPERTQCLPQPSKPSNACQSWKTSMRSRPWMSSARPSTPWSQERHQAATLFVQTSSNTARLPYCTPWVKFSASAGERERCPKT